MTDPEGTYLVWIDFSGYGLSMKAWKKPLRIKPKLWLDSGKIFGPETAQFERFNMAAPRAVIEEAFGRLKKALEN